MYLNRKDAYGFFLEPVDTSIVTDYLTIITNPMDLGTMRKKVANNEYSSIDSFKVGIPFQYHEAFTYKYLNIILLLLRTISQLFVTIARHTMLPKLYTIKAPKNFGLLAKNLLNAKEIVSYWKKKRQRP